MKFPDIGGGRSAGGKAPDSGLFIKMLDGDKITGVCRGDPHTFWLHWSNGRSSQCPGKAQCELCQSFKADPKKNAKAKAKFRFSINMIQKVDGIYLARIFEGSFHVFRDLKKLHENGYDLEQTAISIEREGAETDTRYVVIPLKNNGGLKAADFKAIQAIPLNALKGGEAPEAVKASGEPEVQDANEDVFGT